MGPIKLDDPCWHDSDGGMDVKRGLIVGRQQQLQAAGGGVGWEVVHGHLVYGGN